MAESIPHYPEGTGNTTHPIQGALYPARSENVTISGSSAVTSTAFTHPIIRVVSDTDCYVALGGAGVTAATDGTSTLLPAGAIEYFNRQNATVLAVVSKTGTSGKLNVTEMA